jgi:hypothetical protein
VFANLKPLWKQKDVFSQKMEVFSQALESGVH